MSASRKCQRHETSLGEVVNGMHTSSAVSGAPTYVRPGGGALGVNDSLLFGLSALV